MLKATYNRALINVRLRPDTPVLVKSGEKGASLVLPGQPDLMFVRTTRPGGETTVYIPGSSIKGVVRSAAERILRSLGVRCCDPMDHKTICQEKASTLGDQIARDRVQRDEYPMAEVYRMVCYACRTFGSQAIASRVAFSDAYPPAEEREATNRTEARSGVSIDRQTGGPASGKLFEMEVVSRGAFDTEIVLSNYELWQLALVGVVLQDMKDGFVRFGSARSRGLGRMSPELRRMVIDQTGRGRRLAGVGALAPKLREPYGLLESDPVGPDLEVRADGALLGTRIVADGNDACGKILGHAIEGAWAALVKEGRP